MIVRNGIGQDSHRFLPEDSAKPCIIGGVIFGDVPGLAANSDGDVVLHAICNAISSLTGVMILGDIADKLCFKHGITDSQAYVEEALKTLGAQKITHVSISLEGKRPVFKDRIVEMKEKIASIMGLNITQIGITSTSGEGLTDFGCGDGVQCWCSITTIEN